MTPQNFHALQTTLAALPVTMVYTRKLLQSHNPPATVKAGSLNAQLRLIRWRANTLTDTLKGIQGYNHFGLND